jgi:hypothetical protein
MSKIRQAPTISIRSLVLWALLAPVHGVVFAQGDSVELPENASEKSYVSALPSKCRQMDIWWTLHMDPDGNAIEGIERSTGSAQPLRFLQMHTPQIRHTGTVGNAVEVTERSIMPALPFLCRQMDIWWTLHLDADGNATADIERSKRPASL